MPPRANWKGYLRLSLVSCPIALYPASSLSEKVSFNRINRKTGNRLKQQNVDSETGEEVPRADTARGYEIGKGQYLIVEDDELEAVQVESTRTIEIDQFVPRNEIDDRYIDSPYYIAPDGQVGQDTLKKANLTSPRSPISTTTTNDQATGTRWATPRNPGTGHSVYFPAGDDVRRDPPRLIARPAEWEVTDAAAAHVCDFVIFDL